MAVYITIVKTYLINYLTSSISRGPQVLSMQGTIIF
jgi:hypothetical protein